MSTYEQGYLEGAKFGYKEGFESAIECLKAAQKSVNNKL